MNKHAIYHIPNPPYAYGKDLNTLIVRIRTAKNDIKACNIYYRDRYDWETPYDVKEMKIFAQTDLFDFYEVEISVYRSRYRYYFELIDNDGNVLYFNERGFSNTFTNENSNIAFQFAYIGESDLYREEKWLQEATVYQIFPDRFNNGDKSNDPVNTGEWGVGELKYNSMYGGDIQGIIDKLDYLEDLGVDLIYLTPIFKSSTNHKYNTKDYYDIDPQFGTLETARELVAKCREKGIKVIFDAVFNHSGGDFFAFEDLLKNQENSKYKDWYFADNYPVSLEKSNYYTFAHHVAHMPKLNTNNKEVKEYLLKVGEYWVKEIGIDGWRLDVCDEVDHTFWREFRKVIKEANKDAIIIGEIMHESSDFLRGDQLDSIMNYPFKSAMVDFFAYNKISVEEFDSILAFNRTIYMDSITRQMWNLLGSHDTKRFLTECNNNLDKMKLAIGFQFSYIGVPYIYYGDEVGLTGGDDPHCRGCMEWDVDKQNKELLDLYKQMIAIRKENKTLIYGDYKQVYCQDNVLLFEREYEGDRILVAINNNEVEYDVNVVLNEVGRDIISAESVELSRGIKLRPMEFRLIRL